PGCTAQAPPRARIPYFSTLAAPHVRSSSLIGGKAALCHMVRGPGRCAPTRSSSRAIRPGSSPRTRALISGLALSGMAPLRAPDEAQHPGFDVGTGLVDRRLRPFVGLHSRAQVELGGGSPVGEDG